jgi:VanZ family protein
MKDWIVRWGPALACMGLIFIFSATPSNELPNFGGADTLIKKLGHTSGYALLSLGYARALNIKSRGGLGLCWLLAVIFALSDEFHQSFVAGRNASLVDVGIDATGSLAAMVMLLISARLRSWIGVIFQVQNL